MAPKNRIILDTDPGVDDTMAMLLALSASPEDLELVLLSVTYGNVPLESCLRNVVALFHVIEKEIAWREANGKPNSFESLKQFKPLVAVGPDHPLEEDCLMADYFHGVDGLHGVHEAYPDLSPADTWQSLFKDGDSSAYASPYFTPAKLPAHKEILRILKEEPENTISICAVGPLTNIAMAAAEDPETFLRVKELVVMGGAVHIPGNITPVGEFNTYADAVAAARVYALTSPTPASTMPPIPSQAATLPPYPAKLSKQLKLSLCPLDITMPHSLTKSFFEQSIKPHVDSGSPLARWIAHILSGTFNKITDIVGDLKEPDLSLHDPLTVWYMMTRDDPGWQGTPTPEDIRIETSGQWTRGMHLVDKRVRSKRAAKEGDLTVQNPEDSAAALEDDEVHGDSQGWLSRTKGNRINRIVKSPGEDILAPLWMKQVFG